MGHKVANVLPVPVSDSMYKLFPGRCSDLSNNCIKFSWLVEASKGKIILVL